MRLRFIGWALSAGILACQPSKPPAPKVASPALAPEPVRKSPFQEKLEVAEALREAASHIAPPTHTRFEDKASAAAFVQGPLREWIVASRVATRAADAAYAETIKAAPNREKAHSATLALAGMWQDYADAALNALLDTAPTLIASDPELLNAYRSAMTDTVAPMYATVRELLTNCVRNAKNEHFSASLLEGCKARLARLPKEKEPEAPPEPSQYDGLALEASPRPQVATTRPEPCVFRGTVTLASGLSPTEEAAPVLVAGTLEVSALRLPSDRSKKPRVEVSWPIAGTYFLDRDAYALVLERRQDLASGHIWLEPETEVEAFAPEKGQAEIFRPTEQPGGAESTPKVGKRVPCRALALNRTVTDTSEEATQGWPKFVGEVPLHAAPNGQELGVLVLESTLAVRLIETRGSWRRVRGHATPVRHFGAYVPYDFDAWTSAETTTGDGLGLLGLLNVKGSPPTHWTTDEMPIYGSPSDSAPVATLVRNVPLRVGADENGFVPAGVPELISLGQSKRRFFWIRVGDLKRATKSATTF